MIHVKEKFIDNGTVALDVGGVLDQGTIPVLEGVCDRHLNGGRRVVLDLDAVVHITREGRGFIKAIRNRVVIANMPEFMALEDEG